MKHKKNNKKVNEKPPPKADSKFATLDRNPGPEIENAFTKTFTEFLQLFQMR